MSQMFPQRTLSSILTMLQGGTFASTWSRLQICSRLHISTCSSIHISRCSRLHISDWSRMHTSNCSSRLHISHCKNTNTNSWFKTQRSAMFSDIKTAHSFSSASKNTPVFTNRPTEHEGLSSRLPGYCAGCSTSRPNWSVSSMAAYSTQPNETRPNKSRIQSLMYATYASIFIGGLLLTAMVFRFYGAFKQRARGVENGNSPLFGRRSRVFKRYRGYVLPADVTNTVVNDVPWFEVRPDDTWVLSFPKAGTTWLQEIVYLISTGCDYEKAGASNIEERYSFLEFPYPGLKAMDDSPSPRFIKSHLPFSLLPKGVKEQKPKVIYIARNPKDTAVSLHAFTKMMNFVTFLGSQQDFADLFLEGTVFYGPWTKHVKEAWEQRHEQNVLFLTYEDLQRDFRGTAASIAQFLDKPLSASQLSELEQHCSFQRMKNNAAVNYSWQKNLLWSEGEFMRKGVVGDWKSHLSPELSAKFDVMTTALEAEGLQFVDEFSGSP